MGLWASLDSAFQGAGAALAGDVQGIGQSVISGLQVRVKTNFGPAFTVGGQYTAPTPNNPNPVPANPGLLDSLGIEVGAQVLSADGSVLFTWGDMPPTNPIYAALGIAALIAVGYLIVRGIKS
jgi:hypothetical protein